MKILHYMKPSLLKREPEDAFVLHSASAVYAAIDGVTPIVDFRDEHGHNGGYLAANLLKRSLERADGSDGAGLVEQVIAANRKLREAMSAYGIAEKHAFWACCVAAVQIVGESLHYAQLGDCMVIARYRDGRVEVLTENRVKGVSARAVAKRAAAGEREEDYSDTYLKMKYNRTHMANSPDGYGVMNGEEAVASFIQSGEVPLSDLSHVLLVSDGMFHPELPLEATMELILSEGFERYVEQVEAAEHALGQAPDDRTGVLLSWV